MALSRWAELRWKIVDKLYLLSLQFSAPWTAPWRTPRSWRPRPRQCPPPGDGDHHLDKIHALLWCQLHPQLEEDLGEVRHRLKEVPYPPCQTPRKSHPRCPRHGIPGSPSRRTHSSWSPSQLSSCTALPDPGITCHPASPESRPQWTPAERPHDLSHHSGDGPPSVPAQCTNNCHQTSKSSPNTPIIYTPLPVIEGKNIPVFFQLFIR